MDETHLTHQKVTQVTQIVRVIPSSLSIAAHKVITHQNKLLYKPISKIYSLTSVAFKAIVSVLNGIDITMYELCT